MVAKAIFVGGAGSHAGKSWVATALCRHLRRRGLRVAPFKAQNMSNNSCPCVEGGEIGRAQAAQAEACDLEPSADMNPILLKPVSDCRSQVVLGGKAWRDLDAREYYQHFDFLLGRVLAAYERLAARFDSIVVEGAGSIAEVNLRRTDLVNLGLAERIQAPGVLVADIDRGGVFASIAGTFGLLEPRERALVRSFVINRFRGDPALFEGGVRFLEHRTGKKCLGVFPYVPDISLDAEDAVGTVCGPSGSPVAIISFPHISNLTDFRLLAGAARITAPVAKLFDCIILPGTKNTLGDLGWLRARGLDRWVLRQHAAGARIVGICGGYQMLGEQIEDPDGGTGVRVRGLGLLPVGTVALPEKITRAVEAVTPSGQRFRAYEIHAGATTRCGDPFVYVGGAPEGARANNCIGTYLHGALEDAHVLSQVLGAPVEPMAPKSVMYDRLADWFEQHADLAAFGELYL